MVYAIKAVVAAVISLFAVDFARAAEIKVMPSDNPSYNIIIIKGELEPYDQKRFANVAVNISKAFVVFDSNRGSAIDGIEIGKAIHLKEFATLVPSQATCASASALAWLGGQKRFMGPTARIGFHAVYTVENGEKTASGLGNARVGAYLSRLDLPERAIDYITNHRLTKLRGSIWIAPAPRALK